MAYGEGDVFDDQVATVDDTNDCEGANSQLLTPFIYWLQSV